MISVADYIAKILSEHHQTTKTIFLVSGGGNMFLIDAVSKNKNLQYVCNHHEQACAMAAEGIARVTNKIGIAMVTTGPGGTNAITGVIGAWLDSIPIIVISGQVKLETTIYDQPGLRQLGDQEINIVDLVRPVTKSAVMITHKDDVRYQLEKALFLAKNGRPGPVWIDIPLNIQNAMIDPDKCIGFIPHFPQPDTIPIGNVINFINNSKRPIIIAGNGIFLSNAKERFDDLSKKLQIPVVATLARYDIIPENHPFYFGRYGSIGHRAGNFIVQNSDLVIAIGARMNIRAVSYNWENFAREAKIISVDIDPEELCKKTVHVDLPVCADAGRFIDELNDAIHYHCIEPKTEWIEKCHSYKRNFSNKYFKKYTANSFVNSYIFFDILSDLAPDNSIFVFGNGTASVSSYQTLKLSSGQSVIVNSGCASMGYDLPAAIGASYGANGRPVICVTGDGSVQMNIQELQTIIHNELPIKIFILNNEGYISIRNTQNNFFKGHLVGSDRNSGISFPDMLKIADAYGLKTYRIDSMKNLAAQMELILKHYQPVLCEIMIDPNEKMEPKLSSAIKSDGRVVSKPLEDMFPFIDRELFLSQMIVKPVSE